MHKHATTPLADGVLGYRWLLVCIEGPNGRIEISERWSCPNARSLKPFVDAGVEVLLSTDAHMRTKMGRYERCAETLAELGIAPRGGGTEQPTG